MDNLVLAALLAEWGSVVSNFIHRYDNYGRGQKNAGSSGTTTTGGGRSRLSHLVYAGRNIRMLRQVSRPATWSVCGVMLWEKVSVNRMNVVKDLRRLFEYKNAKGKDRTPAVLNPEYKKCYVAILVESLKKGLAKQSSCPAGSLDRDSRVFTPNHFCQEARPLHRSLLPVATYCGSEKAGICQSTSIA